MTVTPADLAMFAAIGVPEHVVRDAGIRRVTHDEARELCGIRYRSDHLEGLAIPYRLPDGGDEPIVTWRVRRDHPEQDSDGRPIAKYVSPPDRKHWYFSPGAHPQLADTTMPVIFVESPKSVLAITAARLRANRNPWPLIIAIDGCWGFRCVIGKAQSANGARVDEKGPAPDFDRVTWTGRDTIICYDSNAATNEKVQVARKALSTELAKRGAHVRVVDLPLESGINGPDDFIGKHGAAAFWALVDAAQPAAALRAPVVTFLSSVQPEPVEWIWPGRLARGKYTLVSGEPGLGKTYLLLDCAARISTGRAWPDGARAPKGRVLYLTAEDGIADTLRPRLDGLGGDPANVAVLEAIADSDGTRSAISLARDLDMLAAAIRTVDPVLVVLDPITAYMGKVDTHRDSDVRSTLAPLVDLVEQRRCALVAIGHLSKDAQRAALHRPGGSIAFVAAARLVLALAADPNDPERRLLASLKRNLCGTVPTLAYRIGDAGLAWESDAVADVDVEAMFRPTTPGEREEYTDAEAVIRDLLDEVTAWPLTAKDALAAGAANGIHERTMQRTARKLGIRIARSGFGREGKWLWHRPSIGDTTDDKADQNPDVSSMAPMTNHSPKTTNNNIDDTKSSFPRARSDGNEAASRGRFSL